MIFAVVHTENWDVLRTYKSREDALERLRAIVGKQPDLADEVGLRTYESGQPVGEFEPASVLLRDSIAQRHLV